MSDTGEQGVTPQDPARRAGVGGGLVPDDQGEGRAQQEEIDDNPPSAEAEKNLGEPGPAQGSQRQAEPGDGG